MGTLKTTLKVESTDLFPTPVSFTTVNNNAITANLSGFTTLTVGTGGQAIATTTIAVPNAFLYVAAPSTNTDAIIIDADGTDFATLEAGDVGFFPIGDNATSVVYTASAALATQTLNYYVGTR
jgi:hypothetical protein